MQLRVINYNTLDRVHQLDAHSDYLRSIAVHPSQPFILTSSGTYFMLNMILTFIDFKNLDGS